MKKRVLVLLSIMILFLSSSVSALAFGGFIFRESVEPLFDGTAYVWDSYGYMDRDEVQQLEQMAESLSEHYQCGMYMAIVEDIFAYTDETYDVYEAATEIYREYDLGMGEGKNGTLLILSMDERDYALIAYGDFANAAFTDYGKDYLSDVFLDDFGNDDWYDGFYDYLEQCGRMLEMAEEGNYFDVNTDPASASDRAMSALVVLVISAVISGIVCAIMCRTMKSVGMQRNAATYVLRNSLRLGRKVDLYTHTTESRQRIENNTNSGSRSGGGTTIRSGGFSGKSGKF